MGASGLTFASVHGYGLSRRKPSFAAVVKLSKALGVSCEAFAECEDVVNGEPETPSKQALGRRREKGK